MKPKFFFDYIFYRATRFYSSFEGKAGATTSGVIVVTWIQSLTLLSIVGIILKLLFASHQLALYAKTFASTSVLLIVTIFLLNNFRFKKSRYELLEEYWFNESTNLRLLRGLIIVLLMILSVLPLILGVVLASLTG